MRIDDETGFSAAGAAFGGLKPAAAPRPHELSILIVTWNSARWIETLPRVDSAPPAAASSYEVIVYDNASSDDTLHIIGRSRATVLPSAPSANDGFARRHESRLRALARPVRFPPQSRLRARAARAGAGASTSSMRTRVRPPRRRCWPTTRADRSASSSCAVCRRSGQFAAEIFAIGKLLPAQPTTARYRYRDLDLTHPQRGRAAGRARR